MANWNSYIESVKDIDAETVEVGTSYRDQLTTVHPLLNEIRSVLKELGYVIVRNGSRVGFSVTPPNGTPRTFRFKVKGKELSFAERVGR